MKASRGLNWEVQWDSSETEMVIIDLVFDIEIGNFLSAHITIFMKDL